MANVTSVYGSDTYGSLETPFVIGSGGTLALGVCDGSAVGGGTVLNGTIESGATLVISSGKDNPAPVLSGVTFMGNVVNYVRSDASGQDVGGVYLSNVNVYSGVAGSNYVWSAIVDHMTISGGSITLWHGRGSNFIVRQNGLLYVAGNGARLFDVVVSGGWFSLASGNVTNLSIYSGTVKAANGNGVITNVVAEGGTLDLKVGASSSVPTVNGLQIRDGATVNLSAGNVYGNVTTPSEMSGGVFNVVGGTVSGLPVTGGVMNVAGGVVLDTTLSAGAINVSGGTMDSLRLLGGTTTATGGTLSNLYYKTGDLSLANVTLTGNLNLYQAITVDNTVTLSDLTLNMMLTERTAADPVMISDYTVFQSASSFAVTVLTSQSAGVYQLMGNASTFDGTVSVYANGDLMGSLGIGESCDGIFSRYTLNRNGDDTLCLTLTTISSDPIVVYKNGTRVTSFPSAANFSIGSAFDYDRMYVTDGGTATGTTLAADGVVIVTDGGLYSGGTVNSGAMTVEGGVARGFTMSAGSVTVLGGVVSSATVSGGTMTGSAGLISDLNARDGLVTVSGGTVLNASVSDLGNVIAVAQGKIVGGTVYDYGMVTAEDSGTLSGVTAGIDGNVFVQSGGSALDLVAANSGYIYVGIAGTVDGVVVSSGGNLCIESGTTVLGIDQKVGGALDVANWAGGGTLISGTNESGTFQMSNGVGSGFILYENGFLTAENGAYFVDTVVNSGGWLYVEPFGSANGTVVNSGGEVYIASGASATGIVQNVGAKLNFDVDDNLGGSGGVTLVTGTNANGSFYYSGAVASNLIIYGGAFQYVSGGTALGTVLSSGAEQVVVSGGIASGNVIYNGAFLGAEDGGTAIGAVVSSGGVLEVSSNSYASDTIVKAGGTLNLMSGAVHSGTLTVEAGAVVSAATGGVFDVALYELAPGQAAYFADYSAFTGSASFNVTIKASETIGTYAILGNASGFSGTITVTDVCDGVLGTLSIGEQLSMADRVYTLTKSGSDVCMTVAKNGTVEGAVMVYAGSELVYSGGMYTLGVLDGSPLTSMYVSGGTARLTTVRDGGTLNFDTGIALSTFVSGGTAALNGTVNVLSVTGGEASLNTSDATGVTVTGGTLNVAGGTAADIAANGGSLLVNNGIVSALTVSGGAVDVKAGVVISSMDVQQGLPSGGVSISGTVCDLAVGGGADYMVQLHSGAVVSNATMNTATTNSLDVGAGAVVSNLLGIASKVGASNVRVSGTVIDATMSGGVIKLFGNGHVDGTINILSGAALEQAYYNTQVRGTVNVYDGGQYTITHKSNQDARITSGAEINLYAGATMTQNSRTLNVEGVINLRGGTINNAGTTVANGLVFSGGQLNFLLNGAAPMDTAYVANYAALSGDYSCSIDVGANQTGSYKLFGSAADFSGSIILKVEGVAQDTLTLTHSVTVGDFTYSLVKEESDLVMSISSPYDHSIRLYEGDTMVSSGAYMAGVTLDATPYTKLEQDAGLVTGLTVLNGGSYVISGGSALGVIHSGATASTLISGGGLVNSLTVQKGTVSAISGAVISGAEVLAGGTVVVLAGATAKDLLISGGLTFSGAADARAVISGAIIRQAGTVTFNTYTDAYDVTVSGGILDLNSAAGGLPLSRVYLSNLTIDGASVWMNANGVISGATVNSGTLFFSQGARGTDLTVNGGRLSARGGTPVLSNITANGGVVEFQRATVTNVYVNEGGYVSAGACNGGVTITGGTMNGGTFVLGGTHSGTAKTNAIALYQYVVNGGTLLMSANDPIGTSYLHTVNGLTINGGVLSAAETNNVLTGTVNMTGGQIIVTGSLTDTGASYVFHLNDRTVEDAAFISDVSYSASTNYTVTVAADQATGIYKIAGASTFDKSISLTVGDAAGVGTLTVGGTPVEYNDVIYTLGITDSVLTLAVTSAFSNEITIAADSYNGKYDGQTHTASYSITAGTLKAGDELEVTVSGSITDVGEAVSSITSYRVMRGTEDVTSKYTVTTVNGSLNVTRRSVTITSGDAQKDYDGTPLTCDTITVTGDGFVDGEGATYTVTGSQTNLGSSPNYFTYTLNDGTKEGNYDITKVEGTLTVSEKYPAIIGSSVYITSPAIYGEENMGFVIGEGGTLYNGYVEGSTIYTAGTVTSATVSSGGVLKMVNTAAGRPVILKDVVVESGGIIDDGLRYPTGSKAEGDCAVYTISGLTINGGTVGAGVSGYLHRVNVSDFTLNAGSFKAWSACLTSGAVNGGYLTINGVGCFISAATLNNGTVNGGAFMAVRDLTMVGGVLNVNGNGESLSGSVISGGTVVLAGNYNSSAGKAGATPAWNYNNYLNNVIYGGDVTIQGGRVNGLTISGGAVKFTTSDNTTTATASSGTYLSGVITLGGAAQVEVRAATSGGTVNSAWIKDTSANWNFNLSNRTSSDAMLINDVGFSNAAGYTITVAADQASGSYLIAGNASGMDQKVFSLVVGASDPVSITVNGDPVETGVGTYTLAVTGGNLTLTVEAETLHPVTLLLNGDIVTGAESYTNVTLDGTTYDQMIVSGGTATGTTVNAGTDVQVLGGTLQNTVLFGGAVTAVDGTVSGVTVSGGSVTLSSGAMTNVQIEKGASATVDGATINDFSATSAAVVLANGAVINGGTIVTAGLSAFYASAGTLLSNVNISAAVGSGAFILGSAVDLTISGAGNGMFLYGTGENVTFNGGEQRVHGTVINAEVNAGSLRLFNGKLQGTVNVHSNTSVDMAYYNSMIDGTLNLLDSGTYLLVKHELATAASQITVNGVVNLEAGSWMGTASGAGVANLTINGAINLNGGQIRNTSFLDASRAWVINNTGSLNFDLAGMLGGDTVYVYSYNNLNATAGTAFTITADFGVQAGNYILFGDASEFSTRNQTISVTIGGSDAFTMALGEEVEVGDSTLTLSLNASDQVVMSITVAQHPVMVFNSGNELVQSGNNLSNVVLDGTEKATMVLSGGTVTSTSIANGAALVFSGAGNVMHDTIISADTFALSDGAVYRGIDVQMGTLTLSDANATDVDLTAGAVLKLMDGTVVSGGTMTANDSKALTICSGAELNGGTVVANTTANAFVVSSGAVVSGTLISAAFANTVNVLSGAIISGATVSATSGYAVALAGYVRDLDVAYNVANGVYLSAGGVVENLTMSNGTFRNSGTVINADVYGGELRLTNNGTTLTGITNVYGGGIDTIAGSPVINGTVNLWNKGTYLKVGHSNTSIKHLGEDGVINVYTGATIRGSGYMTRYAGFAVSGAINLCGGRMIGTAMYDANRSFMFYGSGSLNFKLAGLTAAADAYVASYNILNKASGAAEGTAFTVTADVSRGSTGNYILFGDASEFSSRNQTISFSIDGETRVAEFGIGDTYVDVAGSCQYALTLTDNVVTLSGTAYTPTAQSTTTVISTEVNDGRDVAATWDSDTTYSSGQVAIGNGSEAYEHTALVINNDGTVGKSTQVFGGAASGADLAGEADIDFQGGTIQAIMGGAANAADTVGGVDLTIGGNSSAITTVVYGGGYGSVDNDIKTVLNSGAQIGYTSEDKTYGGQIYGGPMVLSSGVANAVNVGGNIILDVEEATVYSDMVGGARVLVNGSNTTTVAGSASVLVNGGTFSGGSNTCLYGAGWVVGNGTATGGTDYSVNGVNITITADAVIGTTNGRGIFGGALVSKEAKAVVSGDVNISVLGTDSTNKIKVSNIFGGGWAQTGAESNVTGNVTISLTNVDMAEYAIIGGGAHALKKVGSELGSTSVGGNVSISAYNCNIGSIYAAGQVSGDVVSGSATVTLSGTSEVGYVKGCGYDGIAVCGEGATLTLDDFSGSITKEIKAFSNVSITGDSTANFSCGASDVANGNWTFDLTEKTDADTAALTWAGGSFNEDTIRLDLSSSNVNGWTVFNLASDSLEENAVTGTTFNLYIDNVDAGSVTFTDELKSYTITGTETGWNNATLAYTEDGLLKFALA